MVKVSKSASQWQQELTADEYRICRGKGTEPAFSGRYWKLEDKEGVYHCRCCNEALFSSNTKYDSGSGWPSFRCPLTPTVIDEHTDRTLSMSRTEVLCSRCDAHLGHVFNDGPVPEGTRYCINSASLQFQKQQ